MKKLSFTLIAVFATATLFAYTSQLNLTIYSSPNVKVIFDGKHFPVYNNTVVFNNIYSGNHFIRIEKKQPRGYRNVVLYTGKIYIPNSTKVFGIFDTRLGFRITETYPIRNRYDRYSQYNSKYPKYKYRTYKYKSYNRVMNEYELDRLLRTLRNVRFDDTRVDIAIDAVRDNLLTSSQVYEILRLFSFESSRLKVAKAAYPSTVDKERFYMVFDAFSFDSSIRELKRYIHSYRF